MAAHSTIEVRAEVLRRLHWIHRQRTDLINQINRGPRQIAAAQGVVAAAQAKLDDARSTLKKTQMAADAKQLQLTIREDHVNNLQAKLNMAANNKEYQLIKDQLAADLQANSVQSDEIFEVLEQIDELTDDVRVCQAELAARQSELGSKISDVEDRLVTLKEDLQRVESQLTQAEADLPAAAKELYLRLTAARGEEALAPLEGDSCGGCSQTLTTSIIDQLRLSKLTHCPSCNTLLYVSADTRVGG